MTIKSKYYRGKGPEIVWVGEGAEVCGLGYESDKYRWMKEKRFDVVSLGLHMGFLLPKVDEQGEPVAVIEAFRLDQAGNLVALQDSEKREILLGDLQSLTSLNNRWHSYLEEHTGVRSIGDGELSWSPAQYEVRGDLKTRVPEPLIGFLKNLGISLVVGEEVSQAQAKQSLTELSGFFGLAQEQIRPLQEILGASKVFEVTLPQALLTPFPFKVDFGAPLPTGWQQHSIGLSRKEVSGLNPALVMAHEIVYRALLQACLHPAQTDLWSLFPSEKVGLYLGSGIGAHEEHQQMIVDTLYGDPCGAKALANCIANIACGYISGRLGLKGKISTHVGACETCLGSIGDAYRDLKAQRFYAAIAGGFDDAVTASSYNAFTSNMAFATNEKFLENLAAMVAEGVIDDPQVNKLLGERQDQLKEIEEAIQTLEENYAQGKVGYFHFQKAQRELKIRKRLSSLRLPKALACYASMPFAKYRSGFVMGIGGGAGFFTTLEHAIHHGLPIRAYLAGVAEMVPDSGTEGSASIAALGDGVGDAYERAFLESKENYFAVSKNELKIEDIGVWFAHGTSTPLNGWGERREIERIHQKYGRNPHEPILITGDKAEVGHRIAGNFPSLVGYIFATNEVLPVGNYLQAGYSPKGRRGFGEPLDELFPSSRVVGKAGLGKGAAVPYQGDYVAVNGAGFGRINTVLIFRRFRLDEIEAPKEVIKQYADKLAQNVAQCNRLKSRILFGSEALVR